MRVLPSQQDANSTGKKNNLKYPWYIPKVNTDFLSTLLV